MVTPWLSQRLLGPTYLEASAGLHPPQPQPQPQPADTGFRTSLGTKLVCSVLLQNFIPIRSPQERFDGIKTFLIDGGGSHQHLVSRDQGCKRAQASPTPAPCDRIIQPKMSVVSRLRNPTLHNHFPKCILGNTHIKRDLCVGLALRGLRI